MPEVHEYKCPNCGGKLEFDSSTQKMNCPYCDSEIDVEAFKNFDDKINSQASQTEEPESTWQKSEEWTEDNGNVSVYTCSNCGGEIIAEDTTAAMHCPYCDNPVIFTQKVSGMLKPDYVIPFKLSKEDAKSALKKHLKGKPLLPKVFRDENHIDEIKGVYVPFWLYDAKVDSDITFEGTRVRTWTDRNYRYTETSHFEIERDGTLEFENVPADGSSKMPDDLMESIEPFDFSQAVDFQTAYLSGYLADKYDVEAEQNIVHVRQRMSKSIVDRLSNTIIGYGGVHPVNNNTVVSEAKIKYALYPVYILNTTWKGQKFVFAMNGQTGKFVGDLPTSKGKFAAAMAGLTVGYSAVAGLIAYLLGYLG